MLHWLTNNAEWLLYIPIVLFPIGAIILAPIKQENEEE